MIRIRTLVLTLFIALFVAAPTASAASAWRNVTGDTNTSLTVLGMARDGATGPLRVVWAGPGTDPNTVNVMYTRDVLASGALGPVRTVLTDTGAGSFNNPALARNPVDGSFWLFNSASDIVEGRLFAIQSTDGGTSWTPVAPISTSASAYASFGNSAAFAADGTSYQSFMGTFRRSLAVDPGEDDLGNAPGIDTGSDNGCCVYWSQVAIDAVSGTPYVGWFSNLRTGRYGIEVVDPATGAISYAPGSADAARGSSVNGNQPTPITGRIGAPGVYVGYCSGYPSCTSALVWKHGTPKAMKVGVGTDIQGMRISPAPGGRLWAFWRNGTTLFARRSNTTATAWGETVSRKVPGSPVWQLHGEGSAGYLDAFAHVQAAGTDATYVTRLMPGLTAVSKAAAKSGTVLVVRVTDAGVPVPGATVRLRGKAAKTNAAGIAKVMVVGAKGAGTVSVTRPGFTATSRTVKITK